MASLWDGNIPLEPRGNRSRWDGKGLRAVEDHSFKRFLCRTVEWQGVALSKKTGGTRSEKERGGKTSIVNTDFIALSSI